ncbi:hypothetical protein GCM10009670_16780 [Citricoccus alkalitolerans]
MTFKDLASKGLSFANGPQGRKMIHQATSALRRRASGKRPGAGRASGIDRVMDAARRFTGGPGGQSGDGGVGRANRPPRA